MDSRTYQAALRRIDELLGQRESDVARIKELEACVLRSACVQSGDSAMADHIVETRDLLTACVTWMDDVMDSTYLPGNLVGGRFDPEYRRLREKAAAVVDRYERALSEHRADMERFDRLVAGKGGAYV